MTTQLFADTKIMNVDEDINGFDGDESTDLEQLGRPHEPQSRRSETPEQRRARIEAITRAVRNGTYDTEARAKLGAEAFFRALTGGR